MNIRQKKKAVKRKIKQKKPLTKTEFAWMEKYYSKAAACIYSAMLKVSMSVNKLAEGLKPSIEAFNELAKKIKAMQNENPLLQPNTEPFECENGKRYAVKLGSPAQCLVCKNCSDVFYDENGPYMWICKFKIQDKANCKKFELES